MQGVSLTDVRLVTGLEAIVLDAVGTLIYPDPPVSEVYQRLAARHGCDFSAELIGQRFRDALQAADWSDARAQRRTWRKIVGNVFPDMPTAQCQPLFEDLWNYFGQPGAWSLFPDVVRMWEAWSAAGFIIAIASNFDDRLPQVLVGLPRLAECRHIFWSSQVGHAKPDLRFFRHIERSLRLNPRQLLMVGDSELADYQGPRQAGWHACLVSSELSQRHGK